MKLLLLVSFASLFSFFFHTNEENALKKTAKQLYAEKKYLEVIKIYTILETKYRVNEPRLLYNHANACYRSLQLRQAFKYYQVIADGKDSLLASEALNQMGIICCKTNKLKEGKELFIQSIRKHAANQHAVLNLEWAMTLKDDPKKNAAEQEKIRQQKKESAHRNSTDDKTDPDSNGNESESLRSDHHKNKYMDINKARLLLESMKNSEKQYIQQLPVNTTPNPNEPNW
ncbi:MAG TPA: hypothetical protein VK750_10025 [Cytophagaceae bacterium]|jgi:hypothetical protein|nr:hypothetical protein [Cytophagaceae bacterium]